MVISPLRLARLIAGIAHQVRARGRNRPTLPIGQFFGATGASSGGIDAASSDMVGPSSSSRNLSTVAWIVALTRSGPRS